MSLKILKTGKVSLDGINAVEFKEGESIDPRDHGKRALRVLSENGYIDLSAKPRAQRAQRASTRENAS